MTALELLFEQFAQRVAQIMQEGPQAELGEVSAGSPSEGASVKQRVRRTKAQIEADKAAAEQQKAQAPATVATAPTVPVPAPAPFVPQNAGFPGAGFGVAPTVPTPAPVAPTGPISMGFGLPPAIPAPVAPAPVAPVQPAVVKAPTALESAQRLVKWIETDNPQDRVNRQQWISGCQSALQTTPGADLPPHLANCNDAQAHEWVERVLRLDPLMQLLVKYTQPRVEAAMTQIFGAGRHIVLIPTDEWNSKLQAFEQACVG